MNPALENDTKDAMPGTIPPSEIAEILHDDGDTSDAEKEPLSERLHRLSRAAEMGFDDGCFEPSAIVRQGTFSAEPRYTIYSDPTIPVQVRMRALDDEIQGLHLRPCENKDCRLVARDQPLCEKCEFLKMKHLLSEEDRRELRAKHGYF